MGCRGEGLCRPHLAEGAGWGVSVLQHRRARGAGGESAIWVRWRLTLETDKGWVFVVLKDAGRIILESRQ